MAETVDKTLESLSAFHHDLRPYLSTDPSYVGEDQASRVFPYSRDPGSTLHHGTCFAEDFAGIMLDARYPLARVIQRPLAEIRQDQDALIYLEDGLGYLTHELERMINADERRPFEGYDFLAPNLRRYAGKAARQVGLPVIPFSSPQIDRNSAYPEAVIKGEALGFQESEHFVYIAGFSEHGIRTLLALLTHQLTLAQNAGETSALGEIVLRHLGVDIVEFMDERFKLGQQNVLDQLKEKGLSVAQYLSRYWWLLNRDLIHITKKDGLSWRSSAVHMASLTEEGKTAISGAPSYPDLSILFNK